MGALAAPHRGRSMRATSTFREGIDGKYDRNAPPKSDFEEQSNRDNFRVPPGETHTLLDAKGPGCITHIWVTFLGPEAHPWAKEGSANHQELLLRIFYDGSDVPGVDAPFGDFFASCFGKRSEVISLPVIVEGGDAYNCFWHMPFRESCRIEIVNQSEKQLNLLYFNVDWIQFDEPLTDDTPYFYAHYRQAYTTGGGEPYTLLETVGRGHYVGTVFCVRTRSPYWFGEGDEMITIDGEDVPSIWGTGTEDYFLSAWGMEKALTPYFGVPFFDQFGIVGGHTSAYRWHINDPVVFSKSIKVQFETFGWISPDETERRVASSWNPREDDYASVAFWYQTGTPSPQPLVPHARDRHLPSIDRLVVLAWEQQLGQINSLDQEDLPRLEYDGRRAVSPSQRTVLRYAEHFDNDLLFAPWDASDPIAIEFEISKQEPLRLLINAAVGPNLGIYRVSLDGVALGTEMDFYAVGVGQREFHLLDFWPEPGRYLLKIECVGQNHLSSGDALLLESVRLRERRPRVSEWAFEKTNDWRTNPIYHEGT